VQSVLYALNDKTGGVLTLNANLMRFRHPDEFSHDVLLLHNRVDRDARWARTVGGDREWSFEYSLPVENLSSVLKRLRRRLPADDVGVLVANDWMELALAAEYDLGRAVIQIVHDEYHLGLATLNHAAVDVFVAHSREFFDRLRRSLPSRQSDIHYLPYGIPVPERDRQAVPGPLRLLFIGRMTENKGVFELPQIDGLLQQAGVEARWTIIGDGPERASLLARWRDPERVRFVIPWSNEDVLAAAAEHDVFVLPTRFEGFPVSLLETMGAGLVPVVSDLPGGISEVVEEGVLGFRPAIRDVEGFARAIVALDGDRARLDEMGARCRDLVRERFDIRERVKAYQSLFSKWRELRRERRDKPKHPYGSRLDKPWIPNPLVRLFRYGTRKLRGKPAAW
jgi:glycosyltransferase involved in cell wall biosynthesis